MRGVVGQIQAFALALGAPGLFIVALLDSSILSLPEIADLLVIWMVVQHKDRLVLYALGATLGSMAGCLGLYYIGIKGGDALVRKRFHGTTVDRALASFRRYGVMAVLVPSVLPPPAPFKVFVLMAGIADIRVAQFALAVGIGRGTRYFVEALLALWYGEQAIAFLHEHAATASLAAAGVLAAAFAGYIVWSRVRRRR